jgi:hypothetical protein
MLCRRESKRLSYLGYKINTLGSLTGRKKGLHNEDASTFWAMSDGSSMYTGSFSRHAVRISLSISMAVLHGVGLACAAMTCATA